MQKKSFLAEDYQKQTLDPSAFLTDSDKHEGFGALPTALSTIPRKEFVFLGTLAAAVGLFAGRTHI